MNLKLFLASAAFCTFSLASAQQINPITQAVLDGYAQVLKENPKDYFTYFQRAAQYYNLSMYDNALTDIHKAIDYTPEKDKDMLFTEYSLLADINVELKQYEKALEASQKALSFNPDSYPENYKKGNILLHLGKGEEAYQTFSGMQRLKSRSQEAYFGMAKACLMTGRDKEAQALISEAEKADPSSPITYCRVGDLYREQGNNAEAAANYLSGFALAQGDGRPLESLIELGKKDFASVASAIDYALSRSDNQTPLYFIKGNIAYETGNYGDAYMAFKKLLEMPEGRAASVYSRLAEATLALDQLKEAEGYIDLALNIDSSTDNLLIKSKIDLASGANATAAMNATKVLSADPNSTEAMEVLALANMGLKDYEKAVQNLGEAIMLDASDPYPLMLRAYIYNNFLKSSKLAVADYNRVARMETEGMPAQAYKALAKTLNGKKMDGDAIIEEAINANPDKNTCFYAAIYYAQTGDLEKARNMRSRAIETGYTNLHNLNSDKTANLNIAPIRHLK